MADDPQAQHYVECTQCNTNAEYYCNTCKDRLCKKCKKKHLTSNATSHHDVVLYRERQTSGTKAELCHIHSALPYTMCCQQCEVPVCQKCIKDQHKKHFFVDIDVIFETKNKEYKDQISKIKNELLSRSTALLEDVREDNAKIKEEFTKIHSSMTSKAQVLKDFIDAVLAENTEFLQGLENSLISELQQQEKTMNSHIVYLQNIVDEYENYLQTNNRAGIILSQQKNPISKMTNIPNLEHLTLPSFVDIKAFKEDIAKVFGKVQESKIQRELRKVRNAQVWKKSDKSMKLIPTATEMMSFTAPGVDYIHHISPVTADQVWISDNHGNLILTDVKGKQSNAIEYERNSYGCHTISQSGDLIFLKDHNTINMYKILSDKKNQVSIINNQRGTIVSMFSSPSTGDILVGIGSGDNARVIRYKKTGEDVHQIQYDSTGKPLYDWPWYITENLINGDVCVSDYYKHAVVVVDRERNNRFSYTGHPVGSKLRPYGISTDTQGNILVSDGTSNKVQMTDKDGHFLLFLLTVGHEIEELGGLSLDVRNNLLWLGEYSNNTVSVYRYKPQ